MNVSIFLDFMASTGKLFHIGLNSGCMGKSCTSKHQFDRKFRLVTSSDIYTDVWIYICNLITVAQLDCLYSI